MKINKLLYFTFLIFYLEFIYKILVYKNIFNINLLYTILFSIPIVFLFILLSSFKNKKINKILCFTYTSIITIYFIFQYVFYTLFSVPFSFQTLSLANQALDFTNIIINSLLKNIIALILFIIPIIILIIFNKYISFNKSNIKDNLLYLILIFTFYICSLLSLNLSNNNIYSAYNIYYNIKDERQTIYNFGLLTATTIDIKRTIFGFNEIIIKEKNLDTNKIVPLEITTYNETDIDFDSLINNSSSQEEINLLNYFKNTNPTNKNNYTGYFKDKNLIFILAEGFNSIAVDKNITPTLYKLSNSGFVFNNFYSPVFLSTTGGEFQATTGLIPTQTILKKWKTNSPNIYYSFGNSFNRLNYTTNAYHNWTYSYYERNKTMKTLGFDSYIACRNGLEKRMNCSWLPSDIDLINTTVLDYSKENKFMTYYITVSGHAPYYLNDGNKIALKNIDYVKNLPYSTQVKAYLATQIELDKALETLINKLKNENILDDTVIALVGDHYPYTLSIDEINQLSSYERDSVVEVNRSNFIIWNNSMNKKIEVNKVGSQIDILPTLLNLFGIEYDSRLIIGKDILSDNEGLAIFSNRSWVSDKGTYFASNKYFLAKDNLEVSQEYINNINTKIANYFTISNSIIEHDIYNKIFK